jgi:PEP-CTERM motif-containing protein
MNFRAAILTVVAACGCAGHAVAAYDKPNTGNSLILFSAWDPVSGASYTRGVGFSLNDFTPALAATHTIDLTADANFQSAFGTDTTKYGNLLWNVVGADSITSDTTGPGAGLFRLAVTSFTNKLAADFTLPNVSSSANNLDFFLNQVNNAAACGGVLANTLSCFSSNPSDNFNINNAAAKWGTTLGGILGFDTSGHVGQDLSFFDVSTSKTGGKGNPTVNPYGQSPLVWNLSSDGELTWNTASAPVPEPSSWLLMSVGLLAMLRIARRRVD